MGVIGEDAIGPMLIVPNIGGVAAGDPDGEIGAMEIGVEDVEYGGDAFVAIAGHGGEDLRLAAVGEGVEEGDGADVVVVGAHIGVEDDGHRGWGAFLRDDRAGRPPSARARRRRASFFGIDEATNFVANAGLR